MPRHLNVLSWAEVSALTSGQLLFPAGSFLSSGHRCEAVSPLAPTFHPDPAITVLISCSHQSLGLSHGQFPRARREILEEASEVRTVPSVSHSQFMHRCRNFALFMKLCLDSLLELLLLDVSALVLVQNIKQLFPVCLG